MQVPFLIRRRGLTRARSCAAVAFTCSMIAAACDRDSTTPSPAGTRFTAGGSSGTAHAGSGGGGADNAGSDELVPEPNGGAGNLVPCNSWPALCERRYDDIVFPTTHAAMANASPPWDHPAQRFSLHQQLQDGIRALMLEVHDREGDPVLCLGDCDEGRVPLSSALADVAKFLAENPREILTLLIDNRVPAEHLAPAIDAAGLAESLHVQASGTPWPTLGAMIDANRRLVVFAFDAGDAPEGILSFDDFFTSTRDDCSTPEELDCELPSGSAKKPLLLVNHFVSDSSSVADGGESGGGAAGRNSDTESANVRHALPDVAKMINENPFLISHLRACVAVNARKPTFVAVDFYDEGALLPATQELNELIPPTDQ